MGLLINHKFDFRVLALQATFSRCFMGSGSLLHGFSGSIRGATPAIFSHAKVSGVRLIN
jgi:hypothetical protein